MSRIDALIKEKCPDGVEYKKLEEVFVQFAGMTGVSNKWAETGNCRFIEYMNAHKNITIDVSKLPYATVKKLEQNILKKGDILFTSASEVPDECALASVIEDDIEQGIFLDDHLFGLRIKDEYCKYIFPSYLKYAFRAPEFRTQIFKVVRGVTRFYISKTDFMTLEIPLPPIEVQQEIVLILDKFTELEAELQAELEIRKKQYQYYLDDYFDSQTKNLQSLSEIGTLQRGKRFVHADAVEGDGVACIHYGELYTYYGIYTNYARSHIREELRPKMRYAHKGDVIIVGAGENNIDIGVGVVWDGEEDVAVHDACYTLKHQQNPKYISYYLRSSFYHNQIKRFVSEGKICSISAEGIGRAIIPIPSMEEQNRVVKIFDNFDAISNDKILGLQAEIILRHKQYEYYRDLLLTFERTE